MKFLESIYWTLFQINYLMSQNFSTSTSAILKRLEQKHITIEILTSQEHLRDLLNFLHQSVVKIFPQHPGKAKYKKICFCYNFIFFIYSLLFFYFLQLYVCMEIFGEDFGIFGLGIFLGIFCSYTNCSQYDCYFFI